MSTTSATVTPTIEPVNREDIVEAAHVYQAAAEALSDQLRARNPWASAAAREADLKQAIRLLSTLRSNDERAVVVARLGEEIVGVAALQIHLPHAHIAFLFVHPDAQGKGVGRLLLDRVHAVIEESGATVTTLVSSRDPKAWQRYLRFGLYPGPPKLSFRATSPVFPDELPIPNRYSVRPVTPGDLEIVARLDRPVRGADRWNRIAAWLDEGSTGSLVLDRETGEPIGYALVSMHMDHGQVGPVVAATTDHVPFLVQAGLHAAGSVPNPHRRPWRVTFSARNHPAVTPLLDAGFVADAIDTWFESSSVGQWDRYVFRDEDDL